LQPTNHSDTNHSVILVNGEEVVTKPDSNDPTRLLISKKGGKKIKAGQTATIQVRNPDGQLSNEVTYTRPQ
jgi:hypothetical protein